MSGLSKFFWGMFWIVVVLIVFVFLANFSEEKHIPVVGKVLGWGKSHAGLDG